MFRNVLLRQSVATVRKTASTSLRTSTFSSASALIGSRNASVLISRSSNSRSGFVGLMSQQQSRFYSPMTKEEEEAEKERVSKLSDFKKEQELRKLNREIMKLNMLKGINTGELYTVRGRYKMLLSDYGLPMMAWYAACWMTSGVLLFGALTVGGLDATAVLAKADAYTGLDWSSRVDPQLGMLGITVVLNEMLEPVRLPFVVFTVKPVMDRFFPPKV